MGCRDTKSKPDADGNGKYAPLPSAPREDCTPSKHNIFIPLFQAVSVVLVALLVVLVIVVVLVAAVAAWPVSHRGSTSSAYGIRYIFLSFPPPLYW
jgi:hypothetical protein